MDAHVTVFTDASYCQHTNIAGWAVWIKHSTPAVTVRLSGALYDVPGSHAAEILAIQRALDYLNRHPEILQGARINIQSDCNGAREECKQAAQALLQHGASDVSLRWVKAHQGARCPRSAVNSWCDAEARKIMRRERNQRLAEVDPFADLENE